MVLKIGLTGGIGSGKSIVSKLFELFNVPVYYADDASKRLYHSNKDLIKEMKFHFGEDIYINDELDRKRLASIVFNDPKKLELLNSLVHPLTILDAEEWMHKQTAPYIIKEAALLFESGSALNLDYIIGVKAPFSMRIKRVMERDGITEKEVKDRMSKQIDEEIKMRLCDFIINNDEKEMVIPQVIALHNKLLQLAN